MDAKTEPKRLENIAFVKTMMMMAVVLYHSLLFFGGNWFTPVEPAQSANSLYYFAKWMGTFHIQTFAMASGFLFYYLGTNKRTSHKYNVLKRAKRLLVPYFFTCILWVVPIGYYFFRFPIDKIVYNYILMVNPSQLWFLVMLFVVFFFFEYFGRRLRFSTKYLVSIFLITTIFGFLFSSYVVNVFQISRSVQYILYFYLGGYIYTNNNKITLKQVVIMIVMTIPLYAFVSCFENNDGFIAAAGVRLAETLVSLLEVSSIYYLLSKLLKKRESILSNKTYRLLERNSFGIYLFHQQIIYFVIFWLNGAVPPIVLALCSFVIALFVSLVMSLLLRRNKVTRFMFGL